MKWIGFLLLSALGAIMPAHAASSALDADLAQHYSARQWDLLESRARVRLAQNPGDDQALWYLGQALKDQASARDALIAQTERCVATRPSAARCHHLLGQLLSARATAGGIKSGLRLAARIQSHYARAVALDPDEFAYRRDLNQFYLIAPALVGGSVRKARLNATSFAARHTLAGQILMADILVYEEAFDAAESQLTAIESGGRRDLRDALRESLVGLGLARIEQRQSADAERVFRRALALDGQYGPAHFGLGRSLLDQQRVDEAIVALKRSIDTDAHSRAHYRLGLAYEAKGQRDLARAMYQAYLRYRPQGTQSDDARARLKTLAPIASFP
jgi:tetratricopeptide (TPR) repeat protein